MNQQRVVFDSRISKKASGDIQFTLPITQEQLDTAVRAYQDHKKKGLTQAQTLERFVAEKFFVSIKEYENADL